MLDTQYYTASSSRLSIPSIPCLPLPLQSLLRRLRHSIPPIERWHRSSTPPPPTPSKHKLPTTPPTPIHMSLPILRIIKNLPRNSPPPTLPIPLPNLPLNLPHQPPKIPIMLTPHIMRQLMTKRIPHAPIIPIPIIRIGAQTQLDNFPPVAIQTERLAVVRGVDCRIHLREHADAEFALAHAGFYAGVGAQAFEVGEGAGGVGEVGEGEEGVEGVGCFFAGFAPVAVGGGRGGF